MTVYMTEAEQIEVIKKWWNKYSNIFLVVLSLILLTMAGFRYWHWHQAKIEQQASNTYEQMMVAFSNQDAKGIQGYADTLLRDFKETAYADAARLSLAKYWVEQENYSEAKIQLLEVARHSKITALQTVARIRLARVLLAEKSYEPALEQLKFAQDNLYASMVNELKGDIYTAMGQYPAAATAYQEALAQTKLQGAGNLFLEMKVSELASLS